MVAERVRVPTAPGVRRSRRRRRPGPGHDISVRPKCCGGFGMAEHLGDEVEAHVRTRPGFNLNDDPPLWEI